MFIRFMYDDVKAVKGEINPQKVNSVLAHHCVLYSFSGQPVSVSCNLVFMYFVPYLGICRLNK